MLKSRLRVTLESVRLQLQIIKNRGFYVLYGNSSTREQLEVLSTRQYLQQLEQWLEQQHDEKV